IRLARFSFSKGKSFRLSTVLKKSDCSTAPHSRASMINRRPSSRIFPCCSRNFLDLVMVTTFLFNPVNLFSYFIGYDLLSPGKAFSYWSPSRGLLRSSASWDPGCSLPSCVCSLGRGCLSVRPSGNAGSRMTFPAAALRGSGPRSAPPPPGLTTLPYRPISAPQWQPRPDRKRLSCDSGKCCMEFIGLRIFLSCYSRLGGIEEGNMALRRALHFVFKVGDRPKTTTFYKEVLGMKILRHEEFEGGCKAACNGGGGGNACWHHTQNLVGTTKKLPLVIHREAKLFWPFKLQEYHKDVLNGITLQSSQAISNARKLGWPLTEVTKGLFETRAPGGYKFYLIDKEPPKTDPVLKVTLAVSDLPRSIHYWSNLLGMTVYETDKTKKTALLGYTESQQCRLQLQDIGGPVDHGTAFGRIAFSCPREELPNIEAQIKNENQTILTPLISLDTPGKATVEVVILADPDGHEICFVGDEAFRELSQTDPKGSQKLDEAMAADKSDEWFAKHKLQKESA
uniref:Glyoxalase domain containing 4 n=1 Tax=Latimeria chalumnae TaxID=7897 RepID=H3AEY3_LATCH